MKITFALALTEEKHFGKKHFGKSDKFAIYTFTNNELSFTNEFTNIYKSMDEGQEHGSKIKGSAIISFLKEKGVSVLVSKQFGQNINMVNQHFIPVIIDEEKPEKVLEILTEHMDWFTDELFNRNENHMLFQIKNGIVKMPV